jgi:hypothetical protein
MFKIKKILLALMFLVLIFPVGADAAISGGGCFTDPLTGLKICAGTGGGGGFDLSDSMGLPQGSIYGIIGSIAYWLLGVFAFFGIIGFVVSGIMYLISAGNDDMISKAKKYMLYSIVGVIVGLMGYVILQAAFMLLEAGGGF